MIKEKINYKILISVLLLGLLLWNLPIPNGLDDKGWHILVIFITTIIGIVSSPMPMGALALISICALSLTKTQTLADSLSGFSSSISWLIVLAFFIAKGFIKTGLGKRVAYILISKFGSSTMGLAYSLIFTEFVLSPAIPSSTARGGGIIFPIAQALAGEFSKKTASFLIAVCFHTNVVTCALFLTAMASNPLIVKFANDIIGVNITWSNWALATIVPGLVNLALLPIIIGWLVKPDVKRNEKIVANAKQALMEIGNLTFQEIVMLITSSIMIVLWIAGPMINIDATTTALMGFLVLLTAGVITWNDAINEKSAWETLIWFSTLLMLSDNLTKFGVTSWIESSIKLSLGDHSGILAILLIVGFFFYIHYFFASLTAHITVMYATFALILTHLKVPPFIAAIGLGVLSNLSGSLTHYGISSAPIYFGSGYFSTKEWWKIGFVVSSCGLLIWLVIGTSWWCLLGWL